MYVAKKIIEINKKIKYYLIVTFYDKFKVIDDFNLRKIVNLAKFCSGLASDNVLSISVLKSFALEEPSEHTIIFLKLFLK